MRNPSGINIRKIDNTSRRKPYQVRRLIGYKVDEETRKSSPIYKSIGSYATRKEALKVAMAFDANPRDFEAEALTFADVYDMWSKDKYPTLSKATVYNYKSAYRHFKDIYNDNFRKLRAMDYEHIAEDIPRATRTQSRALISQIYRYAVKNDIVDKDIGKVLDFKEDRTTVTKKQPFTSDEIRTLFAVANDPEETYFFAAKVALVAIYGGWRPQEAAILKLEDIDLKAGTIVGGIKNDYSRNRVVPIHSAIRPLVEDLVREANDRGGTTLFVGLKGNPLTMDKYSQNFRMLMEKLNMKHSPHETRHTFITAADRCGVDPFILKKIVGHTIKDITKGTYTHWTVDDLKAEIEKVKY